MASQQEPLSDTGLIDSVPRRKIKKKPILPSTPALHSNDRKYVPNAEQKADTGNGTL